MSATDTGTFLHALRDALSGTPIEADEAIQHACAQHYALLVRWNRTHNLTRITQPKEAAIKHYADSLLGALTLGSLLHEQAFLDLGSGAGFPGVLLAFLGAKGTLLDASQKRCSFLETVRRDLSLADQLQVRHGRAEKAPPAPLVVSRATFAEKQWDLALGCVTNGGVLALWATGGDKLERLLSFLSDRGWRSEVRPFQLPSQEARSVLLASRDDEMN